MDEVLGSISCPTKEKNLQTATAHSLLLLSKESVLFHPFHNEALAPHAAGKLFLLIQSTSVYLQSQTTSHPAHNSPMTSHLTQKKIPSSKAITGKTLGDGRPKSGTSSFLSLFRSLLQLDNVSSLETVFLIWKYKIILCPVSLCLPLCINVLPCR